MLDQSDIAHYLSSLRLVKPRNAGADDLTIVDVSRRNRVYLASTRDGLTYVVKQAGPRSAATLINEAAVLRVLAGMPQLAGHVPTVLHEEPDAGRLVLSTPAGARDWGEQHSAGRYPRIPARTLGRTLAALHRIPVGAIDPTWVRHDCAWGLSLSEPAHELLLDMSAGAQDVVARVQSSDTVCRWLEDLRRDRADDAIVHGDLRWENCLALAAPGAARRTRLLLIDWELSGRGTAAFDVGTVLAEYLRAWVWSIPIVDARDPGRLVPRAGHPLGRMRPALQSFWAAYRSARPEGPPLRHVVQLAAVRVLQIAVERAERVTRAPAHVVALLQLADSMLRAPEDAALKLLALRA